MGFWKGFREWMARRQKESHEWHMKNHKLESKQSVSYIVHDIGIFKFTIAIVGLMVIMLAILGIVIIARFLVLGY